MTLEHVAQSRELVRIFGLSGPCIRVNPQTKAPIDTGWTIEPARRPNLWEAKLERWRGRLGIVTGIRSDGSSYLLVIDADLYKAGAEDSLERLYELGLPRLTITQVTPRDGEHLFYISPIPIASRPLEGFPGIDLKCVDGQVVFYDEWSYGYGPGDAPLAELEGAAPVLETLAGTRGTSSSTSASSSSRITRAEPTEEDAATLETLERYFGAHSARWTGAYFEVTRPGKEASDGHSGTVGRISPGGFHCFSSSWAPFAGGGNYDRRELERFAGVQAALGIDPAALAAAIPRRAGVLSPSVGELLHRAPIAHDWLITDLLERGDRLLVISHPGLGKSTLLRQLAAGAALGVNSLGGAPWAIVGPQVRTLIVDLENSERQLGREWRKLETIAGESWERIAELVRLEIRTEGLVLDQSGRDGREDRAWLEERLEGTRPDLLVIGPLYKMLGGKANDEDTARELVKYLDRLRGLFGVSLALEAHPPKAAGDYRVSGSGTYGRWPEFVLHLGADGELAHGRGQREERAWPARLTRSGGSPVPGEWLWTAAAGDLGNSKSREREYELGVELATKRVLAHERGWLTATEIAERVDRRKSAIFAAIWRLRKAGELELERVERVGDTGRKRLCDGFRLAPAWRADDDELP